MRLLLILAALLAGLLAVSSIAAPVPKEKNKPKTTAEKLIGTWKAVKIVGQPVHPELDKTYEFRKDGTVVIESNQKRGGRRQEVLKYEVVGDAIRFSAEHRPQPMAKHWHVAIVSITDKELTTLGPDERPGEENVCQRGEPNQRERL
jgi:uncharacterized protein (TIGR03066 family)